VLGVLKGGEFLVTRDNKVGSGMLRPLWESNSSAIIGEDMGIIKKGEILKIILFSPIFSKYFKNFLN